MQNKNWGITEMTVEHSSTQLISSGVFVMANTDTELVNGVTPQTPKHPVISASALSKWYKVGKNKIPAVQNLSLEINEAEIVAITGASGSGKSTLLSLLGGLEKPTDGSVIVDGTDLMKMSDAKLSKYRGQKIGFVFQSYYLQPFLSVQENIEVPALFAGLNSKDCHKRSVSLAEAVGISNRLMHRPHELSGGQIQRAAIARALINQPKILLADEPTGNLDHTNSVAIFNVFQSIRAKFGTTIVVVTHDQELASKADRILRIVDGAIIE